MPEGGTIAIFALAVGVVAGYAVGNYLGFCDGLARGRRIGEDSDVMRKDIMSLEIPIHAEKIPPRWGFKDMNRDYVDVLALVAKLFGR